MLFLYTSDPDRHLPVIKRLICVADTRIFSAYSGCVRVTCLQYVLMRALRSLQRSISAHFCVNVLTGFPQAVFETIFDDEEDAPDPTLASFLEPKACTQALHPLGGGVDSSAPFPGRSDDDGAAATTVIQDLGGIRPKQCVPTKSYRLSVWDFSQRGAMCRSIF